MDENGLIDNGQESEGITQCASATGSYNGVPMKNYYLTVYGAHIQQTKIKSGSSVDSWAKTISSIVLNVFSGASNSLSIISFGTTFYSVIKALFPTASAQT